MSIADNIWKMINLYHYLTVKNDQLQNYSL